MSRQAPLFAAVIVGALVILAGCHPQQPFYFFEDGDLSHYLDVATTIEFPDAEEPSLCEVEGMLRPFSLDNNDPREIWDLTLENAVEYALKNNKVMKSIGGQILGPPDFLARNPELAPTVYDPALVETNARFGTEAALSAFDAQLSTSVFWERNDTPRNVVVAALINDIFPSTLQQDLGSFQAQISKTAAAGSTFVMRHKVDYDWNNATIRRYPSDWNVQLEAEFRQPLLQGFGVQYNRIAGPGAIPGFNNGVMIARINTDVALADFEAGVRNLVNDVEIAYWESYYAYRLLDAMIAGRDSGLRTWRETWVKLGEGMVDAHEEARARQQYFAFRGAMEQALHDLYAAESKLRYLMGLAATDGRLIRPSDEPTSAKITFDWDESRNETLCRSVELRQQKWIVKKAELELIAAKNYLLPRLDLNGIYRWRGLGDDLAQANGGSGNPALLGSNAYQSLTGGSFQEYHLGIDLSMPIGFRKEMSGVRYAQLKIARERAMLQEQELEVIHQLAYAVRNLESQRVITQTNFNRRIAAKAEVEAAQVKFEVGFETWTLETVLDAQRRMAEAESAYYRSLVDYNKAIAEVHFRKGSLLEYNGVSLAEGPWPAKAYFDAHGRARQRDAGFYLDYGFTRPKVISRGPYEQHVGGGPVLFDGASEMGAEGTFEVESGPLPPEPILTPRPEPLEPEGEPLPPEPAPGPQASVQPETAGAELARKLYDLNLRKLDLNSPPRQAPPKESASGWLPAVKPAGFEEPIAQQQAAQATGNGAKQLQFRWSAPKRVGTRNEPVANPTSAETYRPASGWKGT